MVTPATILTLLTLNYTGSIIFQAVTSHFEHHCSESTDTNDTANQFQNAP